VIGLTQTLHRFEEAVGERHLLTATAAVASYAVDGQPPVAVAFPGSADEVAALLRLAVEGRLSVLVRGAGSHLCLGAPPKPIGLLLALTRLNGIVAYDAEDLTVTAQAGMSLATLQKTVGAHRQMLPFDPPGSDSATLGGIVSTNLTGPMRMRYGAPRDLVIGMRVALSTGEVIKTGGRTVKNVAGYDLGKVFIGSLGSAGVILEITARLTPRPEAEAVLCAALSPKEAAEAAAWLVGSRLEPTSCEIINHVAAQRLRAVLPVTAEAGRQVILIGVSGERVTLERQERDVRERIANCARLDGDDARGVWLRARGLTGASGKSALIRASVPVSSVPAMMEAACALDGWMTVGRAGDGLVLASAPPEQELAATLRGLTSLRARSVALGGHAVLESGPVDLKREFAVWGEVPNADLMRQLKQSYDPADVLGCGRFVV